MKFTKMHGLGNDYVYVNCFNEVVNNPNELSKKVSSRNFGIGSDGLILILPSEIADVKMRIFNADGSEGMMCGNGIRCVGKYVYENNIVKKNHLSVETLSGIKYIELTVDNDVVTYVTVNMGSPILDAKQIPTSFDIDVVKNYSIEINNSSYNITCVSMGNPHCIIFVDDVDKVDINILGPLFENYERFPNRINTEFVQIIDESTIKMRVWERGSNETLACGTGACAAVVASIINNKVKNDKEVKVKLRGGDLFIKYINDGPVIMKGPAEKVFDGEINL